MPNGRQAHRLADLPDRVKDLDRVAWMAEHLVSQFAGIARTAQHHGLALHIAQTGHGKTEHAQFFDGRHGGGSIENLFQDIAAQRTLDGDVVQLIGGRPHPGIQTQLARLLLQPEAGVVIAPDPAEIGLAQAEDGAVVNHPAMLVTHGRIDQVARRPASSCSG